MTTDTKYTPSEADMKFYYERFLPFRYIFQWLNHSPKPTKDFTMREFAYEHRSGAYQRYNSFGGPEEFKESVCQTNPTRFEIGAVYSVNPRERKSLPKQALKPLSKELVFDIDLTDYDDIRTCCSGTDICEKCWKFIKVASMIIEKALREDFGFEHLIWVFSGRRGAHCWVSDAKARQLDEISRKSIVEYLDILNSKLLGNKSQRKLLNLRKPFHPHIQRSFNILKDEFVDIILNDQNPWHTSIDQDNRKSWEQIEELLLFIPDKELASQLRTHWNDQTFESNSRSKWEDINKFASKILKSQLQVNQLNDAKKEIIIYYLYPRLDVEVSRQLIHLLKSPFCIHPGTGNVCVPFNPQQNISMDPQDDDYGFNPMHAPNLKVIQQEFEDWHKQNKGTDSKIPDFEKTSLKPYIEYFGKFVNDLVKEELKKRQRDDTLDF
ncbi:uncharacterized protein KQ657_004807 [Scheffersomyces spartinae]|uniref:DNA primase n=1 Tax=Scheffersomyces spartinae TaxID=45513 RepID=A0A9P8AIR6_9ASCO|nr:uncharacterized protein KQ657_004807 [Scheffersomyces spartinae]KAG7194099.1 hypothetical protein KQ657_004807 [Scheffersomyces spartinae]